MAVPLARVHLKMAHGALPGLLQTPPNWKMLPVFPIPTPCVAAVHPKPLAKASQADADERWDVHKTKSATSASSSPRSASVDSIRSSRGGGSWHKSATSPPPKPSRADSVERWDAHKKAESPAASWSSSCTSSLGRSTYKISLASSNERWDVHKNRRLPQAELLLDDGESSSTGSNVDMDAKEEEEEIVWRPRAMYAGPGFVGAAPQPSMIPMPTSFLVPVA